MNHNSQPLYPTNAISCHNRQANLKQDEIVNSDSITQGSTNLFLASGERTKLSNTSGTNTGDQTLNSLLPFQIGNAGKVLQTDGLNAIWQTPLGSGAVSSVNSQTGTVILNQDNIGDGIVYKQFSQTERTKLSNTSGTNTGDETTATVGTLIGITAVAKTSLVDADQVGVSDSANTNILKKFSWANLKAGIKTYYDSVVSAFTNKTIDGGQNTLTNIAQSSITNLVTSLNGKESIVNKNIASGYVGLDSSSKINQSQLPSIKLGWYAEASLGSGIPDVSTILGSVATNLGTAISTTSVYINLFGYTSATFTSSIQNALDNNLNVNLFVEGQGPGLTAQLASVVSGTYDSYMNILLADINTYFIANPSKVGKIEVRLCLLHEANIDAYRHSIAYNRVDPYDWTSAAINVAYGQNTASDFPLAFARLSNLAMASSARSLGVVKVCIAVNATYSPLYRITDYFPASSTYDYIGIDVYDRFGASSGASFFSVNFDYILRKAFNQLYNNLTEFSPKPILITESGSSSNTTKYSRIDKFINAYYDILYNMPQVVEWTYFTTPSNDWNFTNSQLQTIGKIFKASLYKLTEDIKKKRKQSISPSIITTDLSQSSNWILAGANAGTKALTSATTPTSVGSDEVAKSSPTIQLSMTTSGTDPFLNRLFFIENTTLIESNTPHILSFEAYSDTDNVLLAVGAVDSFLNNFRNLNGNGFIKLSREAKQYEIGICGYFASNTINIIFGIGHNSLTSGNIYISTSSVKIEKGEIATPSIGIAPNAITANSTNTLTNKTISGSTNTLSNIAQSSITNLASDLANKVNARSINSVATNTTLAAVANTDYIYLVSGTTTVTMPTAVGNINKYEIKNIGVATVTIATTASQTIDGSITATLTPNTSLTLISNNSNYFIT